MEITRPTSYGLSFKVIQKLMNPGYDSDKREVLKITGRENLGNQRYNPERLDKKTSNISSRVMSTYRRN